MAAPVTVIYGNKRKLVKIYKGNLDKTRDEIKRKFSQLGDGFILQAKSDEDHFDIEDEDDFGNHSQAAVFVVKDASETDQPENPRPQPTTRGNTDRDVTVMFGGKRKLVTFDMSHLQTTRHNIRKKFTDLGDDFQLLAESGTAGDQYDIDDDNDLRSHANAPMFHLRVVERRDEECHSRDHSQSEATVICGDECKLVRIDHARLQRTRDIISAKFKIGDFRLYAVSPDGIHYEVVDEQDWLKYGNFRTFVIKSDYASLHPQSMAFDFPRSSLPPPYSLPQTPSFETGTTACIKEKSLVRQFNTRLDVQVSQATSLNPRTAPGSLLDNLPGPDTPIVKDAILELRTDIDIPGIHRKMEVFGDCLRLAFYGVAAAKRGAKIKVQEMQFDALKLCKESDLTIVHCKMVSDEIINLLATAFGYLSDGLDSVAKMKFERISEVSKEMESKSKELNEKFASFTEVVRTVITDTTLEQDGAGDIHTFPGAKPCSPFKKLVSFFTINKKTTKTAETAEANERAQIQERINQHIQEEKYEMDQMLSMTERLQAEGDAGEMAATALHGTTTALKSLHTSFETAEKFWSNIHMLCERVAGSHNDMHATCISQEEQSGYWKSKGFQVEATKTYASFMALRTLCHDFHMGMGVIEDNIKCCIQDNPTPEQARSKVKDMAAAFQDKIQQNSQRCNQQLTHFVDTRRRQYEEQETQERATGSPVVPMTAEDVSPASNNQKAIQAPK